ncbi:hypothetical protein WP7S17E08_24390 [Klebsiella quasipneumoniae]|nr:hypothetical protein WP7S17E08_24390 [Klebsiella quasipneumoniae]
MALARLQLTQPEASARLAAVTLLGHSADPETQALLIPFTDAQHEPDAAVREAASDSLQKIKHRLLLGDLLGQAFMGLSWARCCCWPRWGWRSPMACWG